MARGYAVVGSAGVTGHARVWAAPDGRLIVRADGIRGVEPNDIVLKPVGPDLAGWTEHIREQVQTLE